MSVFYLRPPLLFCSVGFVDAVFSLSCSFSQALGKPKPFWFGFPLVFSSSCTRTTTSTRTSSSSTTPRLRPAPVFCFFFFFVAVARSPVRMFLGFGHAGVGFLGGCLVFGLGRLSMLDVRMHLLGMGVGGQDIPCSF